LVTGAALFLDEISTFLGTIFKAYERMWWHALVTLVNRIVSTVLAVIVLSATDDLVLVALAYALGSLGALVFGWVVLVRRFPPIDLRAADRRTGIDLLKQGAPLGLAALLSMAAFRVDVVLLQALSGAAAVGLYGVAYRFMESFLFVSWNLANAALPRLARSDSRQSTARTFEASLSLILLFYLPLAVGSMFLSRWVVVGMFSERFAAAAVAVPWLVWSALLYGVAHLSRVSSVAKGTSRGIVYVALGALAINVTGNLIFIPTYGFRAAAVVTFVTECFDASVLFGMFVRRHGWPKPSGMVLIAPLAAGGMGIALAATGNRQAIGFAVGVVSYLLLAVVAAHLFAGPELRQVASMVLRRRPVEAGS
jgi:O-antigen/teichoic acid export membrane protein